MKTTMAFRSSNIFPGEKPIHLKNSMKHGEISLAIPTEPRGRSVPKVIYDALREAGALVQTHLDKLEADLPSARRARGS